MLKIDADEVLYDAGAQRLVEAVCRPPENINLLCCATVELYQDQVEDTGAWLRAVRDGHRCSGVRPQVPAPISPHQHMAQDDLGLASDAEGGRHQMNAAEDGDVQEHLHGAHVEDEQHDDQQAEALEAAVEPQRGA